jgi:CRP/FNR family cyclic AMP-dependent transcriptional regulator
MPRTTRPELALVADVELFRGLSRRDLTRILDAAKEMDFHEGAEMAVQGEPGGRFFLILEGEARVVVNGRTRRRLGRGDYFGELSLIDGGPRSASVVADTPVRTLSIAAWNFRPLLKEHPTIASAVLLEMCRRLRDAQQP